MEKAKILIVGAGPVGCVLAERCANELQVPVQLIDKRSHIAGNCFDRHHDTPIWSTLF